MTGSAPSARPSLVAALALALASFLGCAVPSERGAEVLCIAVADGDSIKVLVAGQPVDVRLEGIDAPERSQPFSARARQHLASLVFYEPVRLLPRGEDRYGRTLARVRVGEIDVSEDMVRHGLAWHYLRYSDDAVLTRLEQKAKAQRIGLWADPASRPP